jgi:two-component system alkaline phosphatase synthesis response regulator PhoP
MPLGRILVVEDDDAIRQGLCDALDFSGYTVLEAPDGADGLEIASSAELDLVLLDILMPKMDGMQVLTELRRVRPTLPVIFLTAKGEESDRVGGLRAGADDYVVKPFSATELIARVEAVLRRSAERPKPLQMLRISGIGIDFERREATLPSGERQTLPELETELLAYLAANRGRAISRDELLQRVWSVDPRGVQTRTVDMTIARLRANLGDDDGKIVLTVRGKGYMLAADGADA